MLLDELPRIDEHSVTVAAPPQAAWNAVLHTLRGSFAAPGARQFARLVGCDPSSVSGWDHPVVGSTVPGFGIVAAEEPRLLVVAGRHAFSRYGIVVRIEPTAEGARVRAESRASFPGLHGRLYRLAVIGSGGHRVGVRGLLRTVRRTAEQPPAA